MVHLLALGLTCRRRHPHEPNRLARGAAWIGCGVLASIPTGFGIAAGYAGTYRHIFAEARPVSVTILVVLVALLVDVACLTLGTSRGDAPADRPPTTHQ
jgi:hypothetical protein